LKKKIFSTITIVIIVASLFCIYSIQPVQAYFQSTPHSGQVYYQGHQIGNYACRIAYEYNSGSKTEPEYYPTLEVKAVGSGIIGSMSIEVSAVQHNGVAVTDFTPTGHVVSPSSSNNDYLQGLLSVATIITDLEPTGIGSAIVDGTTANGNLLIDGYAADTSSYGTGTTLTNCWGSERGLQHKYTLNCDPSVGGTYTMTVHYRVVLAYFEHHNGEDHSYPVVTDIYETLTYEYVPPHVYSVPVTQYNGYAGVNNKDNMASYKTDGNYAELFTQCDYCGAFVVGYLSQEKSGGSTIFFPVTHSGCESHIFVFVSQNNNNDWHEIDNGNLYSSSMYPTTLSVDVPSNIGRFNYVGISIFDDHWGEGWVYRDLEIDCVIVV
jgi:hypothetical protein